MVAQLGVRPSALPSALNTPRKAMAATRRGRSTNPSNGEARQGSNSRSPARGGAVDADESKANSDVSSIAEWCPDIPGPGCSVDDLRWFIVREFGKTRAVAKDNAKNVERLNIDVDILKDKMKDKVTADQVAVKIINAAEVQSKALDDFKALHVKVVDGYTKDIEGMIKTINIDAMNAKLKELEDHTNALGAVVQGKNDDGETTEGYLHDLEDRLAKFEADIKGAFANVERVEGNFVAHVGQAFAQLGAETAELKQVISEAVSGAADTRSAAHTSSSVGATGAPAAGAHDGSNGSAALPKCGQCGRSG